MKWVKRRNTKKRWIWQNVSDLWSVPSDVHGHKGCCYFHKNKKEWHGYVSGTNYLQIGPCETEQAIKVAIELLLR